MLLSKTVVLVLCCLQSSCCLTGVYIRFSFPVYPLELSRRHHWWSVVGQVCNGKMLPGLCKSYLSEDETGGRGAAIRPLESTPPRIGSSIHLKKERMFSVVVLWGGKVSARGQSRNSCLSVDGPINQHPPIPSPSLAPTPHPHPANPLPQFPFSPPLPNIPPKFISGESN